LSRTEYPTDPTTSLHRLDATRLATNMVLILQGCVRRTLHDGLMCGSLKRNCGTCVNYPIPPVPQYVAYFPHKPKHGQAAPLPHHPRVLRVQDHLLLPLPVTFNLLLYCPLVLLSAQCHPSLPLPCRSSIPLVMLGLDQIRGSTAICSQECKVVAATASPVVAGNFVIVLQYHQGPGLPQFGLIPCQGQEF
jgi:hypothetical protein